MGTRPGRRGRVLLVEDDPNLVDVVTAHVERVELESVAVADVDAAVERLESGEDVDCVVTDYHVEGGSCAELVAAVEDVRPDLPVVLFTAEDREVVGEELLDAVTDYVQRGEGTESFARLRERLLTATGERRLARAEQRFEKLMRGSEEVFMLVTPDGTVERAGPSLERVFGYQPSTVEGDDFVEYVHPEDVEAVRRRIETLLAEPARAERVEVRVRHADGSWMRVEAWARNFLEDPDIGGIVAYLRDVTERVEREEWFRALVEHSTDVTSVVEADGTIQYKGGASERVFGTPPSALVGENVEEFVHEADLDRVREAILPVLDGASVAGPVTYRFQPPGGEERWVESIVSRPETDAVDGCVVNTRNVTERVERERVLRRFEAIIDSMEDAAWTVDDEFQITYANEQLCARLGRSRDELVGSSAVDIAADISDGSTAERYREMLRSVLEGEVESSREQFRVTLPSGVHHIEIQVSTIESDGDPAGAVCVSRDVTDRVRFEERLERQKERLQVLNQIIRHDIRHDMSIISGWLTLLRDEVPQSVADRFDDVIRASDHVMELTTGLGEALAAFEDEEAARKPVPLDETLETEVRRTRDVHPDASVVVDGDLPGVEVLADEMLASVLRNLLVNGITHAEVDEPTVAVSAEVRDDTVRLRVADEGPGLSDPLRTALESDEESVADVGGAGVGLFLVESLVESYDGTVRIEDNEPRGTVFYVELPLAGED